MLLSGKICNYWHSHIYIHARSHALVTVQILVMHHDQYYFIFTCLIRAASIFLDLHGLNLYLQNLRVLSILQQ